MRKEMLRQFRPTSLTGQSYPGQNQLSRMDQAENLTVTHLFFQNHRVDFNSGFELQDFQDNEIVYQAQATYFSDGWDQNGNEPVGLIHAKSAAKLGRTQFHRVGVTGGERQYFY